MTTVTWFHLSDLHCRSDKIGEEFRSGIVLESLWADMSQQITNGLRPDFAAVTGDIAYHGKTDEYSVAEDSFFQPLLQATSLPKERLFVVPGNHDVDWARIDDVMADGMQAILSDRDRINQFLQPMRDRRLAFRKFDAYAEFLNGYFDGALVFDDDQYYYSRVIDVQEQQIAILGLNSAWTSACCRDVHGRALDQGNLLIGERQLGGALAGTEDADLRVALLHHPVGWLHDTDHFWIRKQLSTECDFVLHGHWHQPDVEYTHTTSGQAVYIPAGAIYVERSYPNGYNIVQFDIETRRVQVHLRRYNDERREWIKDIQSTGETRDGVFEFTLFKEESSPEPPSPHCDAKKVLLVEDMPEWRALIGSVLVPPQYELHTANSFPEAALKIKDPFYDLILVNLNLENDFGYEGEILLEDLANSDIPRIVLTGSNVSTKALFERYKVHDVFVKGRNFNKARFREVVRSVT